MTKIIEKQQESEEEKIIKVSYSQYSDYKSCPYCWYLGYSKKLKKYSDSVHTIFGTSIHEALQEYIKVLYAADGGADKADALNLKTQFVNRFEELITESKNIEDIETNEKLEFIEHGELIIDYFTSPRNRLKHFPSKKYKVVGIELPLDIPLKNGTIQYVGLLDLVIEDASTGKIKIIDFKTSSRGWNSYQKSDSKKLNQLLLYKIFYHKKYKVPLDKIDVEFFIVKRMLLENVDFPQSRIQKVVPTHGNLSCKKAANDFNEFLEIAFKNGERNQNENDFPREPGKNRKNCKYCEFSNLNGGKCYGSRKTEYAFD